MGIAESKKATKTASSNIRNIPDLRNGKGARSLKCCDRGIMRRSLPGARSGARKTHGYAGRTFGNVIVTFGTDLPLTRGEKPLLGREKVHKKKKKKKKKKS